jgi:aspartate 1-decarboxylase
VKRQAAHESGTGFDHAAHRAQPGDLVIIAAFVSMTAVEAEQHQPNLVYVDANNRIARTNHSIPKQMAVA